MSSRRPGFTLIEMLVVVGIIALAMGMVAFLPTGDKRDAAYGLDQRVGLDRGDAL